MFIAQWRPTLLFLLSGSVASYAAYVAEGTRPGEPWSADSAHHFPVLDRTYSWPAHFWPVLSSEKLSANLIIWI